MCAVGSATARYGIEITDSPYVVLHMHITNTVGTKVLDAIKAGAKYVYNTCLKPDSKLGSSLVSTLLVPLLLMVLPTLPGLITPTSSWLTSLKLVWRFSKSFSE